jgi:hypothetical protein
MNARKSILFVLPLIALVLMACRVGTASFNMERVQGSGETTTEEREVSGVERVALTGMGDLTLIQGDEEGLTVEADDNLMPYIETKMRGSELVIGIKDGVSITTSNPIRFTLRIKDINRVSVSGSGNVYSEALDAQDFEFSVSGSGNLRFEDLAAEDVQVNVSGSGNFDMVGNVETQNISISGSGDYNAGDLESKKAEVAITGSGNVTVWATEELDIRISGNGNIDYYGSPKVSQSISGGGEIESLGEHE